jgi:hypothetical protein
MRCLFRALLALLAILGGAIAAAAEPVDLLKFPVHVVAAASFDEQSRIASLDITIEHESGSFRFATLRGPVASGDEAIGRQRVLTGWKDGYLFVRDSCGGGNALRCDKEQVFMLVADKPGQDRLVYAGAVAADEDCDSPGCTFDDGVFSDVFDGLEGNAFMSHADAPAPLLGLREQGGRLLAGLDLTWEMNQERYSAGLRCMLADAEQRECDESITPLRALLFNSVLARYVKNAAALENAQIGARTILCDALDEKKCAARLRAFNRMIAGVRAGALPKSRPPVHTLPASATSIRPQVATARGAPFPHPLPPAAGATSRRTCLSCR